MQPEDLLATLIEFSVAVAGFSGVVAALSPRGPFGWTEIQRGLFTALLGSTAISVGITFLSIVLLSAPVSQGAAWVTTSCAHLITLTGVIFVRLREAKSLRLGMRGISIPILIAVCLLATAQAVNIAIVRAGWLCVACLAAYAFLGFLYFVALVRQLWRDSSEI